MVRRLITLALFTTVVSGCAQRPAQPSPVAPPSCIAAPESFECSTDLEALALATHPPGVTRHGTILEFSFQNGSGLRLEDTPPETGAGQVAAYRYHGFLAPQRAHIIHVHYYEGDAFLLVSSLAGRTRDLAGPPILSTDQVRFLSYSVGGGYSEAELQVWRIAPDVPVLELRAQPSDWEPRGARWSAGTRIEVPAQQAPGTTEAWATTVHIELSEGVWSIRTEAHCRLTSGCS